MTLPCFHICYARQSHLDTHTMHLHTLHTRRRAAGHQGGVSHGRQWHRTAQGGSGAVRARGEYFHSRNFCLTCHRHMYFQIPLVGTQPSHPCIYVCVCVYVFVYACTACTASVLQPIYYSFLSSISQFQLYHLLLKSNETGALC